MEFFIIGVAAFFNFVIIKIKLEKSRYADASLDVVAVTLLVTIFGGSQGGGVIAMIASAFISMYLLFSPPKLPKMFKSKEVDDILNQMKEGYHALRS